MFSSRVPKIFQILLLSLFISLPLVSGDHESECHQDSDCGPRARCGSDGSCMCSDKGYRDIPEAKPRCQMLSEIGGPCKHDKQCTLSSPGAFSRCEKDKCECYDTEKNGRQIVNNHRGSCYLLTHLNGTCVDDNQCKASIEPEEHVRCYRDQTTNERKGRCLCDQGAKCDEKVKNGAAQMSSYVAIGLVGIMATRVIL